VVEHFPAQRRVVGVVLCPLSVLRHFAVARAQPSRVAEICTKIKPQKNVPTALTEEAIPFVSTGVISWLLQSTSCSSRFFCHLFFVVQELAMT
jgi:hypothetical protein